MLRIYDCAMLAAADGAPGEITEATTEGLVVAAGGGAIHVKRVRPEGDQKMPAGDFVAASGVEPGSVLGER